MGIEATPLDGWTDQIIQAFGNADSKDPASYQACPMPPWLQANLQITAAESLGTGRTGIRINAEQQRSIAAECVRDIRNYTGTDGKPCVTALDLYARGGKQAGSILREMVYQVLALTWTVDQQGESDGQPASS